MGGETACNACGARDSETLQVQEGVRILADGVDARFDVRTALCRHCGLVFTDPQPDAHLLESFYARQYRDLFAGEGELRIPGEGSRRDQVRWLEARLGALRGRRVLEIGCYEGYLLRLLAERGARCVGVEPCERAAALGRERWGVDIRTGGYEELELEPGSFDVLVLSHVAEHLRDPADALARCRRLLRPGGALFVEVPNVLAPRVEHVVNFFTFDHLYNFSPATLRNLAGRFGFRCEHEDADFPFPAFRYLGRAGGPAEPRERGLRADPEAVRECRRAVRRYVEDRRVFVARLRERLRAPLERWRKDGCRVAIYGAGDHTEHLLQVTELRRANVVAVVDADPSKQATRFCGYPVLGPEALPRLRPHAVVISSYDFQEEMAAAVRQRCAPAPEILTLYGRTDAFSSYRGAAPAGPGAA